MFFDGQKLLVTWLNYRINIMVKTIEISSIGAKPVENPNIPAGTDDGNDIEKLDFGSQYTDPDDLGVRTYTGTEGANTFQAEALLNGKPEILTRFTRNDGTINWEGVAGTNDNYHDHWIEGPGEITIERTISMFWVKQLFTMMVALTTGKMFRILPKIFLML